MDKFYQTRDPDHHNVYARIIKSLNESAMDENSMWGRFDERHQKALLLISGKPNWEPVGYLMWTRREEHVIVNQIWIKKKYRRQGAGLFLLQDWYDQINSEKHTDIIIESPTKETVNLLVKIGYIHKEEERYVADKVSFIDQYDHTIFKTINRSSWI
jgi:hypothetical protein